LKIAVNKNFIRVFSRKLKGLKFVLSLCMDMVRIDLSVLISFVHYLQSMLFAHLTFQEVERVKATLSLTEWNRNKILVTTYLCRDSIINHLRRTFKKFILWGRSMGATSSLLYCLKYQPKDVIMQIIDSPFYSF